MTWIDETESILSLRFVMTWGALQMHSLIPIECEYL